MTDTIESNLAHIAVLNRRLAHELAKLPEISLRRTDASRLALDNIIDIYRFCPERFDVMFARMHRIGMPEHRPYCSPLQAFFWMIADNKLKDSGKLLGIRLTTSRDAQGDCHLKMVETRAFPSCDAPDACADSEYTLRKILDSAWNTEAELMQSATIHDIIDRLQNEAEAKEYALLARRHNDLQLQGYIMDDFLRKKEVFCSRDWDTIEKAVNQSRWKLFYTVADRLNAPELISYYINNFFWFRKTPASGVYFTFFSKRAQCTDAAYFAKFMLDRSGYKTFMRSVKWNDDPWDGLHTGAGIVLENGSYLLVANYTGVNSISGPYPNVESLDHKLACERTIIGSRWGAYFPPRHY